MRSPNRFLGVALGTVFVLIGVAGISLADDGVLLDVLQVNVVSSILHTLVGAALLLAALSNVSAARTVNSITGAALLVLGLAGLFLVGSTLNILALDAMGNALHFASAVPLLAAGLGADRAQSTHHSDRASHYT